MWFWSKIQWIKNHVPTNRDDYLSRVAEASSNHDSPQDVAKGILDGVHYCAREIIPTRFALDCFERNGEDVSRMWHPGLEQPSREEWDWWTGRTR